MRFHFTCELQNEELPIDYRRKVVGYLKFCTEKSNKEFFEELYGKGENTNKEFTMSIYFVPETEMGKESIAVKSKRMIINLSTPDTYTGIQLYNAVCKQKFIWFSVSGMNAIRVINIQNEKEKVITRNTVIFNTLSPIVIRDHDRTTGKDWFYTLEDENAVDILKRNLLDELKGKFQRDISYDIKELKITAVNARKVIIKCYELKIPCTLGKISITGEQYLLQYLYQRGIGSKRSMAFGMIEQI